MGPYIHAAIKIICCDFPTKDSPAKTLTFPVQHRQQNENSLQYLLYKAYTIARTQHTGWVVMPAKDSEHASSDGGRANLSHFI